MCETDGECVRLCLDGHAEKFRDLVKRYEMPLRKYLAGRLGNENDVVEAAQETMVRAYFSLPKLKKAESFYPWLLGIAGRVAMEMHRARHTRVTSPDVENLSNEVESDRNQSTVSDQDLSRAITDLSEIHQQVILLRFYGGQSCAEISRNLGVSTGTVTSRLSRAYSLLREALRKQDKDVKAEK